MFEFKKLLQYYVFNLITLIKSHTFRAIYTLSTLPS